jgi:hypothetical protein
MFSVPTYNFFRSSSWPSTTDEPLADDESLMDSKPEPIQVSPWNMNMNMERHLKTNGKTRRDYGKKTKSKQDKGILNIKLGLLGTNSNGISNRIESLKHAISVFLPNIVTLQETKVRKLGSVKLRGYQVFEKIRTGGSGGGLLTAVDEHLSPVLISTGQEEDSEVLTVQAKVGHDDVRIINAYGPQEDDGKKEVFKFWQEILRKIVFLSCSWMLMLRLVKKV